MLLGQALDPFQGLRNVRLDQAQDRAGDRGLVITREAGGTADIERESRKQGGANADRAFAPAAHAEGRWHGGDSDDEQAEAPAAAERRILVEGIREGDGVAGKVPGKAGKD